MGAFEQVHPSFRAALSAASGNLCRTGPLSSCETGEDVLHAEEDGRCLHFVLRKGKIRRAVHSGVEDPAEQAVFDVFCQALECLPIQEAADHSGHHVVARLRDPSQKPPVSGIVTPWNADPLFHRPMRLIRQMRAQYAGRTGKESVDNFWNPKFSRAWLDLEEAEQLARLDEIMSVYLAERGFHTDDMQVVGIEGQFRVLVGFAETIDYKAKPGLLMDFERRLRTVTGDRLEVFAEEMKDGNRIRRL